MKIDLVGPKQRGLAMGFNEFAGYLAVSLSALATGYIAATYGMRPAPFLPGFIFVGLGLILSLFFVRETREYVEYEANLADNDSPNDQSDEANLSFGEVFRLTSWGDRALFSSSQAGLVNNLNDGMVWGLVPLLLVGAGLELEQVAIIAATYPAVWGIGQLFTGALSDKWGRKWLIVFGMWLQAAGIIMMVVSSTMAGWLFAAFLLGLGTAMVYPTLLAAVSDVAHPVWRGSAVGVYRLWRDLGFAFGAIVAGLLADLFNISVAVLAIGGLTFISGLIVATVMYETLPERRFGTETVQAPGAET